MTANNKYFSSILLLQAMYFGDGKVDEAEVLPTPEVRELLNADYGDGSGRKATLISCPTSSTLVYETFSRVEYRHQFPAGNPDDL